MKNKMILKYVGQNWWRYIIGFICLIISVLLDICFPLITKSIIDDVIIGGQTELLWSRLVAIVAVGVGRAISQYVKEFIFDVSGSVVASKTRKHLFNHIQTLSRSYFDRNNTGELMARVKDDVDEIWDMFGFVGMLIVEALIYTIGVVICMVKLNWQLSIVPLVALPVIAILAIRLEKKLDKVYDQIREQNAVLNTVAQESFSGVRTVKSFAREEFELEKFRSNNQRFAELNVSQELIMAKTEPWITFIPKIMQLLTVLVGGISVIYGNVSYGILVAFIQYSNNIVWPMENIGWLTDAMASGVASYKKVNKILKEEPEIKNSDEVVAVKELNGNLRFENVSYEINGNKILDDISFCVSKGKTVGIMGATGSGKSTIVNLISRFYDVTDGSILIDDIDIRRLPLDKVRKNTSVVTQDVFLFSDTIKENVRLGARKTMPEEKVRNALLVSHASEFVDKLSEGCDTIIGERGVGLSGGQKQRLSIARAIAKEANLLILDDSTSALDMEAEQEIQKELLMHKGMGKIIIAHRISSVKDADEIIILQNGKIAERGTHKELLSKKGLYYSTYEAQYGDYHNALEVIGKEELVCR